MMVERGLGIGLVPDVGDTLVRGRDLCRLAPPAPKGHAHALPARELGLLWQRTSPRLRWAHSLMECTQHVVQDEAGASRPARA